jgi:uncharacterized membrane protein YagU involved in acid resistance
MILFLLVNYTDWAMWSDLNTLSLVHFLKHLSEIFKMVCWIWQIFIDAQINAQEEKHQQ